MAEEPAHAAVDMFGNWTFRDLFPGMQAYATQAYTALAPLAYLIMGALIAEFVIATIIYLVMRAVRADVEDDDD